MSEGSSAGFRRTAVGAVVLTYLLIVWGGVVRVTGSGLGCGDRDQWPLCQGRLLPPLTQAAVIEFTHRWLAAVTTAVVLVLATWAWLSRRHNRRIRVAATVVVAFFVVQIALGAVTVMFNLPGYVVMIHLGNALLLLGGLVFVAVNSFSWPSAVPAVAIDGRADIERSADVKTTTRMDPGTSAVSPTRADRLALIALAATYLLALSGALVVAQGAGAACAAWPLCGNGFALAGQGLAAVNLLHRFVAAAVLLLLGYSMVKLRRSAPGLRGLGGATMAVNLLLLGQVVVGALVVELRLPAVVRGIHLALASALWVAVLTVVLMLHEAERRGGYRLVAESSGAGRVSSGLAPS